MSPDKGVSPPPVTLDDLKQKAGRIRDIAEAEVRRQTEEQWARNAAIVAGVVLVAIGFAYFLGSRRSPKSAEPPPCPCLPPERPYRGA